MFINFREKGREERERNIVMRNTHWLPPCAPLPGIRSKTWVCAGTSNRTCSLLVCGKRTTGPGPGHIFFKDVLEVRKYGALLCARDPLPGMKAVSCRGCSDDGIKFFSLCFPMMPFITACSWVLIFPQLFIRPHPCGNLKCSELSLSILQAV